MSEPVIVPEATGEPPEVQPFKRRENVPARVDFQGWNPDINPHRRCHECLKPISSSIRVQIWPADYIGYLSLNVCRACAEMFLAHSEGGEQ